MHNCAAQITHEMNSAASASTSGQGPQAPPSAASADMAAVLHPTDMEVEVEDSLLIDHEAPAERTDADFFNGATPRAAPRRVRPRPPARFGGQRPYVHVSSLPHVCSPLPLSADFDDDFDDEDV